MQREITRRQFLEQVALGLTTAALDPSASSRWLSAAFLKDEVATNPRAIPPADLWRRLEELSQSQAAISDEAIPTRFFYPGYTQDMLDASWQNGDLVNGFPYGLIDTHTLGGIPDPKNVNIDPQDGSAILSIQHLTTQELADLEAVQWKKALMLEGEKNGLEMKLSTAVFNGRLPTDTQSIEASVTLPQRIVKSDRSVGMLGTGWALWTNADIERLAANLTSLGVPPEENSQICQRVYNAGLEEDIAEMGIGKPSATWNDPLVLQLIGGDVVVFMAGRKTPTQKTPRADILHILREPLAVNIPPGLTYATIRGWLAQDGSNQNDALRLPLRVKLEIGAEVYDPTRDAMVVPMSFHLNDRLLTPTVNGDFPGFENDKGGSTTPNLSIWKIRTRQGDWVTIPRKFVIDIGSTNRSKVEGDTDSVRFSNLIITRRSSSTQN